MRDARAKPQDPLQLAAAATASLPRLNPWQCAKREGPFVPVKVDQDSHPTLDQLEEEEKSSLADRDAYIVEKTNLFAKLLAPPVMHFEAAQKHLAVFAATGSVSDALAFMTQKEAREAFAKSYEARFILAQRGALVHWRIHP